MTCRAVTYHCELIKYETIISVLVLHSSTAHAEELYTNELVHASYTKSNHFYLCSRAVVMPAFP